ncbi:MAG TPA: sulfatase-like hydrolase/transferase, partial [Thermoanaerobaculia bacterium]|nr:sulfatase-like hydrolase/transferase [Thermoanaerobaculia bacterium]
MRLRLPVPPRVALLLALALAGCGGRDAHVPTGRPIVVVSIDTLRSDRLPAYGYEGVETPAIDALRQDSVLFERAYSPVPLTLPAHASLLTGLLPPEHGVRDNAGYRLEEGAGATAAEALAAAGYATGAAVSAYVMRAETGLARGFEHYDDELSETAQATIAEIQRSGPDTLEAAL